MIEYSLSVQKAGTWTDVHVEEEERGWGQRWQFMRGVVSAAGYGMVMVEARRYLNPHPTQPSPNDTDQWVYLRTVHGNGLEVLQSERRTARDAIKTRAGLARVALRWIRDLKDGRLPV